MTQAKAGGHARGMLLFSTGVFFFAITDALAKWLVVDYSVSQILLVRTLGAALVLVPLLWRDREALRVPDQIGLHLVRVACMVADTYCFYFATRFLPLADVMTFYLAAPLIITAMAVVLLGERVSALRWGAVAVGLVGVVIALRPTAAAISAPALLALLGATLFAAAITTTRQLRRAHWLTLVAGQFAGAGLVAAAASPFAWVWPAWGDAVLMGLVGITSMCCFMCINKALALTPASVLAPLQYASIVWAALLGWAVWGDRPDASIAAGGAIIIASGLLVVRLDRRAAAPGPVAEPVP